MKLPIKDIKTNPKNPRLIKDDKFNKLVQSLKDFPEMADVREIVVNKDHVVLGGNMRLKAMQEAGWTEAPVKVVNWSQDKQDEFVVKDNASFGEWDWDELANQYEAAELIEWGVDLPESLLPEAEIEEDEAPEVSSEPAVSKLGEVYQLGRHRVMCGDSTDRANVELLMNGDKADMVFTDPPYGVSALGGRRQTNEAKNIKAIENDDLRGDRLKEFIVEALSCIPVKKGAGVYICYGWKSQKQFSEAIELLGWTARATITWVKNVFGLSAKNNYGYRPQTEFIYYATPTSDYDFSWYGGGTQSDVWNINRPTEREGNHPTPKPIELVVKAVNNSSKNGDIVVDTFLGSGSTLIACEQTDRTCYGMELDPKYVDVIRKRYHKFVTGEVDGWELATPAIM